MKMEIGIGMRLDRCTPLVLTIRRCSMQPRQTLRESVSHSMSSSRESDAALLTVLGYLRLSPSYARLLDIPSRPLFLDA
jgi:hypothetical protein